MEINKEKYPRGKAEFSSFEESEYEHLQRICKMTPAELFENCMRMMEEHGPPRFKMDDTGNEFLLTRKK